MKSIWITFHDGEKHTIEVEVGRDSTTFSTSLIEDESDLLRDEPMIISAGPIPKDKSIKYRGNKYLQLYLLTYNKLNRGIK